MLGYRQHHPLPGRLFRNGAHFDFMLSFVDFEPTGIELGRFIDILLDEVEASRQLERIIFDSRKKDRERFTVLHRPLRLQA